LVDVHPKVNLTFLNVEKVIEWLYCLWYIESCM